GRWLPAVPAGRTGTAAGCERSWIAASEGDAVVLAVATELDPRVGIALQFGGDLGEGARRQRLAVDPQQHIARAQAGLAQQGAVRLRHQRVTGAAVALAGVPEPGAGQ